MSKNTVMTPEQIHLGLYKRGEDESAGEATIVPRRVELADEDVQKEVRQLVEMVAFIQGQDKTRNENNKIELQCTTAGVEKLVREKLGKKARHVKFLPPKVESIRGQYGRK